MLTEVAKNLKPSFPETSGRDFWSFVDQAKWGDDNDVGRIQSWIVKSYAPEQVDGLRSQYDRVMNTLRDKIDDVVGVSDDQFESLASHIVGMGRGTYDQACQNKTFAQTLIDQEQYKAGFSQIFPDKSAWKETR